MKSGEPRLSAMVEAIQGLAWGIIVRARALVSVLAGKDGVGATQQDRSHQAAAREWRVSSNRHQGGAGGKSDD